MFAWVSKLLDRKQDESAEPVQVWISNRRVGRSVTEFYQTWTRTDERSGQHSPEYRLDTKRLSRRLERLGFFVESFDTDEEIADLNGLTLKEAQQEVSFVMKKEGARADLWPFGLLIEMQSHRLNKWSLGFALRSQKTRRPLARRRLYLDVAARGF